MVLRTKFRKEKKRKEYALLSKTTGRVLKWFDIRKPSKERIAKEEKRINFFKYMKH